MAKNRAQLPKNYLYNPTSILRADSDLTFPKTPVAAFPAKLKKFYVIVDDFDNSCIFYVFITLDDLKSSKKIPNLNVQFDEELNGDIGEFE